MLSKRVTIKNKLGLHARAAAKFVAHASRYASHLDVIKEDTSVNGKSIMGVMMLAASKGSELELRIEGDDADAMMSDLIKLIDDKFGEGE